MRYVVKGKKITRFFIVLGAILLVLLSLTQVTALGIAPSFYTFDSIPTKPIEMKMRILNTQQEDLLLSLEAKGAYAHILSFSEETVRIYPHEQEKEIIYTLTPSADFQPGTNSIDVLVRSVDDGSFGKQHTNVEAKVALVQKIQIIAPYPEQHLTGKLFVTAEDISKPIVFTTHLINRGSVDATPYGTLVIKGPLQNKIGEVRLTPTFIASSSSKKVETSYYGLEEAGVYLAEAAIQYGDKTLLLRKDF